MCNFFPIIIYLSSGFNLIHLLSYSFWSKAFILFLISSSTIYDFKPITAVFLYRDIWERRFRQYQQTSHSHFHVNIRSETVDTFESDEPLNTERSKRDTKERNQGSEERLLKKNEELKRPADRLDNLSNTKVEALRKVSDRSHGRSRDMDRNTDTDKTLKKGIVEKTTDGEDRKVITQADEVTTESIQWDEDMNNVNHKEEYVQKGEKDEYRNEGETTEMSEQIQKEDTTQVNVMQTGEEMDDKETIELDSQTRNMKKSGNSKICEENTNKKWKIRYEEPTVRHILLAVGHDSLDNEHLSQMRLVHPTAIWIPEECFVKMKKKIIGM